ncbi:GerAB/ArcD/ProY family transporter [Priestia megaterium]|uniref:GerAB/ArcD/ProY family transporter n=1 Tax=Priestia megaterium TaxID=1404 RepID=UPI0013E40AF0|nr:GerAB/ArcD/ProY family transporter [Priestia megaterium]MED3863095.1 GerAB/ArcD/ProY family transporter [Priestia megaterium]MED4099376.1 GerAB/ArcD/ProY family transporter [Priestia megaterium]MED4144052.1 GerAB/ArcD/ProY family transporter [Priestia megaterium]MED4166696.1 GerAB/ArcD/ProY family transporter [Priestia megaterium]MED4196994.1 GerAB/ArcD/ProY family transporter [Priestia megaterium]
MEKAKLSVIQLFALMFIFEMGTALVVSYGTNARKDAWLAILLALCGGIVLFYIFHFLYRQYPNLLFTGYIRELFGKYLGWIVGLLYCLHFLYICGRNVRELGDLLVSSTLSETPLLAINLTLVLVICYVIHLGIEVVGRTAEVFMVVLLLLGAAGNFFVLVSGDVDFHQIRPFLECGWKPIFTTAFPHLLIFPFGEMIAFTMLLPYLNRPQLAKRAWLAAMISSGVILSWTVLLNTSVLGIDVMQRSVFPTLTAVGKVNLFDFIERLDAIVVFTLLITVFFKASIYLYAAVLGIADLFKLKTYRQILLPIGTIVIFLSLTMASSFSEQGEEGFLNHYLSLALLIVVPMLMLVVSVIRNHFTRK